MMHSFAKSHRLAFAFLAAGLSVSQIAPVAAQTAPTAAGQQALNPAEAQAFIRNVADEALTIIADTSIAADVRRTKLNSMFNEHVAMDYIATLALGRYGRVNPSSPADVRSKQEAQIAEYRQLFPDFMFNKIYDILISKFDKSKIDVIGTRPIGSDLFVNTRIIRPGQEPVLADWRVRKDSSGTFKVIDLRAEGVSMTLTQRDEFASILGTTSNINDSFTRLLTHMSGQ